MRRREQGKVLLLFIAFITLLFPATDGRSENLDFSGFAEIDKRPNISDGVSNGDTYGKLRVEGKYGISADLFSLVSIEGRYYDFPMLEDLPSVGRIESDYHVDLLLWEAYVEFDQFIWENLDVKLGKQRIAWGTADKFNPTDNLNPNDLTDFLDFEAKMPTWGLKASYYLEDYTITGAWLPLFDPALLPRGGTASLLGQTPSSVDIPARTLENGMFALKLSGAAYNLDYSLSYFRGFDDIPIPVRIDSTDGTVMGYPEIQALGFDFAGEYRSVGFWGEMALFYPEEIKTGSTIFLSDDPYLKYTLGADYTFTNGIYLEIQYVHGLFTERGKGSLSDFLIGNIERKFLNDDLTLSVGGGLEVADTDNPDDRYGTALIPEISYRPVDNLEFTMQVYLFGGKDVTLFGSLKDSDQVSLSAELRF